MLGISITKFKSHDNLDSKTPEHLGMLDNEHNRQHTWAH